jgi:hypothetical protein
MTTMRRRATAIDAHLDWTSAPGVGTTVTLMVPLDDGPRRTGTDAAADAGVEAAE